MKLSIIIPCLNQTDELCDCLELISKQTFNSYEVIVIDGGSKENLENVSESISKNITIVSEPDLGIYDAMNKGVSLAIGDWLYFMGVDDNFYDFDVLNSLAPYFEKEKSRLMFGQIIYKYKKEDSIFLKKDKGLVLPIWSKKIWLRNTLHHQGIFYHKSIFMQNRFDIRYKILSDYDFNLKLWKQQVSFLYLNKIIAKCGTEGLSKRYNFNLYKEELILKIRSSSIIFAPLFFCLIIFKYILKKIF